MDVTPAEPKKNVSYTGLVLRPESRAMLLAEVGHLIPPGFKVIAHHCTLCMGPLCPDLIDDPSATAYTPIATAVASNERVVAVKVDLGPGVRSTNATPHITVACNYDGGGKPKDSNDLTDWAPLRPMVVLVADLVEVEHKPPVVPLQQKSA
jgi:hypothetical protein